jgi:tetratricopeptide (TPR) repeat protein
MKKQERNIDKLSKLAWEARGDSLFYEGKFKEAV